MKSNIFILALFVSGFIFGQKITSEEILIKNDTIQLPGTLTFTKKHQPLVIWIHGSGNVDRNGNQGALIKANYIKQLRDSLNQKDIAFFSYDKRTANPKNSEFLKGTLFLDFVKDAQKVIAHFKKDKRFCKITLIGHSQGSLVAMLASKDVDKFVSIAGPSETIDKTMISQIKKQAPMLDSVVKAHFKELHATGNIKVVHPLLLSLFNPINQPFIANWMRYNPSEEIKQLKIPVLLLQGTKDLQVTQQDATILHKSNPKARLVFIENMNHVLKDIEKDDDNLKSYYSPDYPISSVLITTLATYIKE